MTDLLTVWDALLCAVLGEAALTFQAPRPFGGTMDMQASWPFSRDVLLASLVAALMLRDPESVDPKHMPSTLGWVWSSEKRCLFAFGVLLAAETLSRPEPGSDRVWLVAWLTMFAIVVAL